MGKKSIHDITFKNSSLRCVAKVVRVLRGHKYGRAKADGPASGGRWATYWLEKRWVMLRIKGGEGGYYAAR
jgi:hypothetical protein